MNKPKTKKDICYFTIVSKNYMHFAKTLMDSILKNNPGAKCFVVLCDELDGLDLSQESFEVISIKSLNIKKMDDFIFRYNILELNTAIKPYVMEKLLIDGWNKVVYFDPDIKTYGELSEIENTLDRYEMILTPHLTGFLDDGMKPSELEILQSGTYNLGFIAIKNTEQMGVFVKWWQEKLYADCVVDIPRGLFVDQKWMDLVPAIFEGIYVNRNEGWNVAYWNLLHRKVTNNKGLYLVNGVPLLFFHFSGFSPKAGIFSKHQNRYSLKSLDKGVLNICKDYEKDLLAFGYEKYQGLPYAFGSFSDGTLIPDVARIIYREELDWQQRDFNILSQTGVQDFMGYLNEFVEIEGSNNTLITRLAYKYYQVRPDLQVAFPEVSSYDAIRYAHWFIENASHQMKLDNKFIEPVKHALELGNEVDATLKVKPSVFYKLMYKIVWNMRPLARPFFSAVYREKASNFLLNKAYKNITSANGTVPGKPVKFESGINVIGYMFAESGVGQSARSNVDALIHAEVEFSVSNFQQGNVSRMEANFDKNLIGIPKYNINLFHINADQMDYLMLHYGESSIEGRYNIGYWAWELPEFPDEYARAEKYLDEIWTPSEFCKSAIEKKVKIPVIVVPHSVSVPDKIPARSDLKLLDSVPMEYFISIFDCMSVPERKNVDATIDAYEKAFGLNNKDVGLIIKVSNLDKNTQYKKQLINKISSNKGIHLIDQYMDKVEILTLLKRAAALVSLHRSEGFGLVIAEAMAVGTPVVVTGWSGNQDFTLESNALLVNYELIKLEQDCGPYRAGNTWADPSVSHAAKLMISVLEEPEVTSKRAELGKDHVEDKLSSETLGELLKGRLSKINASITVS